jgi:gamma-glutamylcyclotransferase (GGCT)/AIG2-like uncharacterized protein YtfP
MPGAAPTSVFVYGSLMPGRHNAQVARAGGASFEATPASLNGFALLDFRPEGYPGIVPGTPEQVVHGWLLSYTASDWALVLPHLDELEGLHLNPPMYRRERVSVQTPSGPRPAWTYIYAWQERLGQAGCTPVPSGRWT